MIPTAALRQRITVERFTGNGAYGPQYADPVVGVKARVVGKRRTIRRADGTEVISTASVTVRPTLDLPAESRITCPHPVTGDVETFTVLEVLTSATLSQPFAFEVLVG